MRRTSMSSLLNDSQNKGLNQVFLPQFVSLFHAEHRWRSCPIPNSRAGPSGWNQREGERTEHGPSCSASAFSSQPGLLDGKCFQRKYLYNLKNKTLRQERNDSGRFTAIIFKKEPIESLLSAWRSLRT